MHMLFTNFEVYDPSVKVLLFTWFLAPPPPDRQESEVNIITLLVEKNSYLSLPKLFITNFYHKNVFQWDTYCPL